MRVVKSVYEVTPDMRDGFGRQKHWLRDETWERIEDYAMEEISQPQFGGSLENMQGQLDHLQKVVARLIGKVTEVLRLTPGDLAEIVGDYLDEEEKLKLEE